MMKMQFNNMIRVGNHKPDLIKISELLKIFDLDLDLSEKLLNVNVGACLKSAELTKSEDSFEFKHDNYIVTINPNNPEEAIVENTGFDCPICFYDDEGVLYKII